MTGLLGYSVSLPGIVVAPRRAAPRADPPRKFTLSPWGSCARARARGLTKIPNKEVSARDLRGHIDSQGNRVLRSSVPLFILCLPFSLPPSPCCPSSSSSSICPSRALPAAARNFRQRDFSNFHCTSQRDFPHANGMRNVR